MPKYYVLRIIGNFSIIFGVGIFVYAFMPIIYGELKYKFFTPYEEVPPVVVIPNEDPVEEVTNIIPVDAVNTDFAIVIPKIGVNAPVVSNVSMSVEAEYMDALRQGVAHAKGTALPGEEGNIFMFAHSSLNFWQLGPFATVFNLLNKLENGDIIVVVKDGVYYEYAVVDMTVVPGWDTTPFDVEYDNSMLTLITCDPPGTTLNRRVVKAKLLNKIVPKTANSAL